MRLHLFESPEHMICAVSVTVFSEPLHLPLRLLTLLIRPRSIAWQVVSLVIVSLFRILIGKKKNLVAD